MRDDFERGFSADCRYASRRSFKPLGEGDVVFISLLVFAELFHGCPWRLLPHATGITSISQVIFGQLDPLSFDYRSTARFHSPDGELSRSHSGPRLILPLKRVSVSTPMSALVTSNLSGLAR